VRNGGVRWSRTGFLYCLVQLPFWTIGRFRFLISASPSPATLPAYTPATCCHCIFLLYTQNCLLPTACCCHCCAGSSVLPGERLGEEGGGGGGLEISVEWRKEDWWAGAADFPLQPLYRPSDPFFTPASPYPPLCWIPWDYSEALF